MSIRNYRDTDLAAVVAVFTESVHELGRQHYDAAQRAAWAPREPDYREWAARLDAQHVLVADGGVELLGFIAYTDDGHIDLLYTAPRAPRRGVATALYRAAEAALRGCGVRALHTEASLVAQPFFAAQGFSVVEEQQVERRGVTFRRFAMRKSMVRDAECTESLE